MRKKLLSKVMLLLTMLVMGASSVLAQTTVSMTSFSAISGNVGNDANISYEAAKGTAGTAPAVNSEQIRVYQNGGTFTVKANNGVIINSVTIGSAMATKVTYSIDGGTASSEKSIAKNETLAVNSLNCSSVLFTCTGKDKNSRLYVNSLSVTYTIPAGTVMAPTFSIEGGIVKSGTMVTIEQEDASLIIYTTDGTEPSYENNNGQEYTGPIAINETMTIKAIAVDDDGNESDVVSETYTVIKEIKGLAIDFESRYIDSYVDWEFENVGIFDPATDVSAHGGSLYGTNTNENGNGTSTCSITTKAKVANPASITFYISKESTNSKESYWRVDVSTDNNTWHEIGDADAVSMTKGEWKEVSVSLSEYKNVYVRIRYEGTSAIRCIDDITITSLPDAYTREGLTAGNWGTICLPYNATVEGAELYTLVGVDNQENPTYITLDEETSIEAGIPYFFKATATTLTATYTSTTAEAASDWNGMYGTLEAMNVAEGMYLLKSNEIVKCGTGCSIAANRAYIDLSETAPATTGAVKLAVDMTDGLQSIEVADKAQAIYNLAGQRVEKAVRGIYVVNGKKIMVK